MKTVVGEPVQVGETIIIPLIDVTCGMAAGARRFKAERQRLWRNERQDESKCCPGDPCDQAGQCKEPTTKVIDMAPDLINRFFFRRNSGIAKETASYEGKKSLIKNQTAPLPHKIKMEGSCFFYEKSWGLMLLLRAWNGSAFLCPGNHIYLFLCDRMPDFRL